MVFIIIAALLLCGCASFEPPDANYTLPELINQVSLPPWPHPPSVVALSFTFRVHVAADGSVRDAVIETRSGSNDWDSLAVAQVRKWKYAPAIVNGRPTTIWIRQTVSVLFENPLFMRLAELVCPERSLADSLYTLLAAGAPFDSLARKFSNSLTAERGGVLGEVDIHTYPIRIRQELSHLRRGEITKPLTLGRQFVIYKKISDGA
jgi:TonB family protein